MSENKNACKSGRAVSLAQAAAAIANSPAALKLAEAVKGVASVPQSILDHMVGARRVVSLAQARADGAMIEARADAEIERLRAETATYVLDREMRRTVNRNLIVAEAYKALPPPQEKISDQALAEDFVHNFFDEFDGIGDPEMQKIVGRLLAGEVARPGSYHRRTLRVLRDLESADFDLFTTICRFGWLIGDFRPVIFDPTDRIYADAGITFRRLSHLDALGLVTFENLTGFALIQLPVKFRVISYGGRVFEIERTEAELDFPYGKVMLTDAGRQLAPLCRALVVPGFPEYAMGKWQASNINVTEGGAAAPVDAQKAKAS